MWFLEALWCQAKTYTISAKVKNILLTAQTQSMAWAVIFKERLRVEASRVSMLVLGSATVNTKVGQLFTILFSTDDFFQVQFRSSALAVLLLVPKGLAIGTVTQETPS